MANKTKAQTNTYFDLAFLEELEDPRFSELKDLLERRIELASIAKESEQGRKDADKEIKKFIDSRGVDGLVYDDKIADVADGRSAGKWDIPYLNSVLTPEQLERAYTEGTPYQYIKVERNQKRVDQTRES